MAGGLRHADGYEFEVRARTIGQGYTLRAFRLLGPDLRLDRRRFTQTLSLFIFDIGQDRGRRRGAASYQSVSQRGARFSFQSHLRVNHDFGVWATGNLALGNSFYDAVDLVPELESDLLALDVLYAYFAAENLFDGLVDVYAGRQLDVNTLDWWSMDGVTARVNMPFGIAVEAFGGLRVRDASPAGSSTAEPDGTGSGECAEYREDAIPGSGAWRPIDRPTPANNNLFANDYDLCPQREQVMPTFGGAAQADLRLGERTLLWARATYRRSLSPTPGPIGPSDRFPFTDTGVYPNEVGQAPAWGTNEERVSASVRADIEFAGQRGHITPYASGRYNLLLAEFDEGHAGARVSYGAHSLESEVYYSAASFDGDSIFNVFTSDPYTDVRLTYHLQPTVWPWSAYARAWARRFHSPEAPAASAEPPASGTADSNTAGGLQLGTGFRRGRALQTRLDLFHDTGYGGQRTGGYGTLYAGLSPKTGVQTRISVIHLADQLRPEVRGTNFGLQFGASYRINAGIVLHLLAEDNLNRSYENQFRLLGVVDLAFFPEV